MEAATSIFGTFVGLVLFCVVAGAQTHSDLEVEAMQRASSERIEELSIQLHNIKAEKSARLAPHKDMSRIAVPSQAALSAMGLQTFALRGAIDCGRPPEQTCAQNCTSRYTNGSCASYGADYCGPDAVCAQNCTSRYTNGTCASYGADYCGPDAACTLNCTSRYTNGTCASYGADVCN